MILSEKQAQMLVFLLQSSLSKNVVGYLCYDIKQRTKLMNDIVNQQNETLLDLEQDIEVAGT